MFDFLKKKISGFIDGLTKKEDQKEKGDTGAAGAALEPVNSEPVNEKIEEIVKKEVLGVPEKRAPEPKPTGTKKPEARISVKKTEPKTEPKPKLESQPKPKAGSEPELKLKPKSVPKGKLEPKPEPKRPEAKKPKSEKHESEENHVHETVNLESEFEPKSVVLETELIRSEPEPKPLAPESAPKSIPVVPKVTKPEQKQLPAPSAPYATHHTPPAEKPKERLKLGLVSAVKSIITREVEITENDVREMADNFELELLEADVDIGVAEGIKNELLQKLVGARINKSDLHNFVSQSIKETLVDVLTNENSFDIIDRVDNAREKPVKIVFLGINGAGKTTTIAKVARLLQKNNKKIVFAAADTFRAAAIEQMCVHADRLGVKVIKREYGSDPTSVAYDAVNYAKAHGIDAVLIDTAGRQDTNISLINEMKKLNRVIQPDIIVYIGESIAGNAIIEQISAFNREAGVSAVILTKLDCDPKGGTMLSINKATGIPIIYIGTGQGYDDLERFEPKRIVDRIVES